MSDEIWHKVPSLKHYEATRAGELRTYWKKEFLVVEGRKHRKLKWVVTEDSRLVDPVKGKGISVFVKYQRRMVRRPLGSIILETFDRQRKVEVVININGDKEDNRIENLRWGTMEEAKALGKQRKTKLSLAQATEIKRKLAAGAKTVDLGKEFNISQSVVANIKAGRAWKNA